MPDAREILLIGALFDVDIRFKVTGYFIEGSSVADDEFKIAAVETRPMIGGCDANWLEFEPAPGFITKNTQLMEAIASDCLSECCMADAKADDDAEGLSAQLVLETAEWR